MKNKCYLLLSVIILISITAFSQDKKFNDIIILKSGDSLQNQKIITGLKYTNNTLIRFADENKKEKNYKADQVRMYYQNDKAYYSEKLSNLAGNHFVSYEVVGYISAGKSISSKGNMLYYLKKDDDVVCLEEYKIKLYSFFLSYLPDFDAFYKTYRVPLSYDSKTIFEAISAYNAYKFPDKYVFVEYPNEEHARLSLFVSGGLMQAKIKGFFDDTQTGLSFSGGFDVSTAYSRKFGIHLPLSLVQMNAVSSKSSIHSTSLNLDPYIRYTPILPMKIKLRFGAGLGVMYHFKNTYLNTHDIPLADTDKTRFQKLSLGYNASIIFGIKKNITAQIFYTYHKATSLPIKYSSLEDTSVKIGINNIRFMLSYSF